MQPSGRDSELLPVVGMGSIPGRRTIPHGTWCGQKKTNWGSLVVQLLILWASMPGGIGLIP